MGSLHRLDNAWLARRRTFAGGCGITCYFLYVLETGRENCLIFGGDRFTSGRRKGVSIILILLIDSLKVVNVKHVANYIGQTASPIYFGSILSRIDVNRGAQLFLYSFS